MYTVEASNLFHYVDAANKPVEMRADADTHVVAVSGKLAVAKPPHTLTKRASFVGCSSSQQSEIDAAAGAAQNYAAAASS